MEMALMIIERLGPGQCSRPHRNLQRGKTNDHHFPFRSLQVPDNPIAAHRLLRLPPRYLEALYSQFDGSKPLGLTVSSEHHSWEEALISDDTVKYLNSS